MASSDPAYRAAYFPPSNVPHTEGVHYTTEYLSYMTPFAPASRIASAMASIGVKVFVDASAGVGGMLLGAAMHGGFSRIIGYEKNRDVWKMAHANIAKHVPKTKVTIFNSGFSSVDLGMFNESRADAMIVVDPPWASGANKPYYTENIIFNGHSLEKWVSANIIPAQPDKPRSGASFRGIMFHLPPEYRLPEEWTSGAWKPHVFVDRRTRGEKVKIVWVMRDVADVQRISLAVNAPMRMAMRDIPVPYLSTRNDAFLGDQYSAFRMDTFSLPKFDVRIGDYGEIPAARGKYLTAMECIGLVFAQEYAEYKVVFHTFEPWIIRLASKFPELMFIAHRAPKNSAEKNLVLRSSNINYAHYVNDQFTILFADQDIAGAYSMGASHTFVPLNVQALRKTRVARLPVGAAIAAQYSPAVYWHFARNVPAMDYDADKLVRAWWYHNAISRTAPVDHLSYMADSRYDTAREAATYRRMCVFLFKNATPRAKQRTIEDACIAEWGNETDGMFNMLGYTKKYIIDPVQKVRIDKIAKRALAMKKRANVHSYPKTEDYIPKITRFEPAQLEYKSFSAYAPPKQVYDINDYNRIQSAPDPEMREMALVLLALLDNPGATRLVVDGASPRYVRGGVADAPDGKTVFVGSVDAFSKMRAKTNGVLTVTLLPRSLIMAPCGTVRHIPYSNENLAAISCQHNARVYEYDHACLTAENVKHVFETKANLYGDTSACACWDCVAMEYLIDAVSKLASRALVDLGMIGSMFGKFRAKHRASKTRTIGRFFVHCFDTDCQFCMPA